MNPTQDAVEQRIASLEGGVGALLVRQRPGGRDDRHPQPRRERRPHRVEPEPVRRHVQPASTTRCRSSASRSRSSTTPTTSSPWRAAVRPNTKAFFGETISNPKQDVLDIEGVAGVAHEAGVPLIVDNTVATPYLIRPFEWGADVVVHSTTKYLGGHGTAIGGVIVDGGTFDYAQLPRALPELQRARPELPRPGLRARPRRRQRLRRQPRRSSSRPASSCCATSARRSSPFNAFLIAQGLETLSLRVERHVAERARPWPQWLEARDEVESVAYAGLPGEPLVRARPQKYAPRGPGAVLAFEIKGGLEAGKRFVDALELHSHVANIGDVRSLVIHPASTTHSQLSEQEQLAAGVTPGLVRLSVGIEHIDDILADLEVGFPAAKAD